MPSTAPSLSLATDEYDFMALLNESENSRIMELLSPAGNMDSLIAAVQNGADAVYFGGQAFNARRNAGNFSHEELQKAIDYCHQRGVKAYITLNILIHDNELAQAVNFGKKMAGAGADALILQDIGLISLLRRETDVPLHASTQMALHNAEGVAMAKQWGLSRVVLARETPLQDVRAIKAVTDMELELFAHGALCVGFSGQCYFSSLTGGRSGNRGMCAQICRLPMRLFQEERELSGGYMLSPKDLCTVEQLAQLQQAGADCLKLEGRMKRPEYVAGVTGIYREALDILAQTNGQPDVNAKKEMAKLFNRGGFTKGYYFGEKEIIYNAMPSHMGILAGEIIQSGKNRAEVRLSENINLQDGVEFRKNMQPLSGGLIEWIEKHGKRMQSAEAGESVTVNCKGELPIGAQMYLLSDNAQLRNLANTVKEKRRTPVQGKIVLEGNGAALTFVYNEQTAVTVKEQNCLQEGQNPTSDEDIKRAVEKLGSTIFTLKTLEITRRGKERISAQTLNGLRRQAAELLAQKVLEYYTPKWQISKEETVVLSKKQKKQNTQMPKIAAEAGSLAAVAEAFASGADCVYYRPAIYDRASFAGIKQIPADKKLYIAVPNIAFREDMALLREILEEFSPWYHGLLAGNHGGILLAQELQKPWIGDFTLNVFNAAAAKALMALQGAERVTLSVELNKNEIGEIMGEIPCEMVAYGRLPLMFLVHCPAWQVPRTSKQAQNPCAECRNGLYYKDRRGMDFPIKRTKLKGCYHTVFNSKILSLYGQDFSAFCPDTLRLIPEENTAECIEVFSGKQNNAPAHMELFTGEDTTRGHFNRGVQ